MDKLDKEALLDRLNYLIFYIENNRTDFAKRDIEKLIVEVKKDLIVPF